MEITVSITGDRSELPEVIEALSTLNGEVDTELEEEQDEQEEHEPALSEEERYVLAAVQREPRRALRVIHRTATQLEGSPFDDYDEDDGWNDERRRVREILWELKGDLVNNDGQLWFPLEDAPNIQIT